VGQGGNLTLAAGTLRVSNGASLSASTFGQGDAGNVVITVRDAASFDGVGSNGSSSGAGSEVGRGAVGQGGNLTLAAGTLHVTNGAGLSSSTFGQGDAGNIVLRIRDQLLLSDGTVSTLSLQTSGGTIDIAARSIQLSGNSDIFTNVFSGVGGGGNITLTADSIIALGDSDILAFAQDGRGGNVTLNTRAFFGQNYRPAPFGTDPRTLDGNNRVDINVSGVVSGVITLPDVSFIQNSLTQLLQIPIDTNTLMANSCIVRRDRPTGSFFITGAGGLPERPGSPASPAFPTGEVQNVEEGGEGGEGGEEQTSSPSSPRRAWKIGDPIVEPQGVYQLPNGELVLSHECR
jgi:large exoprotein involved in heme utilization and adhesion